MKAWATSTSGLSFVGEAAVHELQMLVEVVDTPVLSEAIRTSQPYQLDTHWGETEVFWQISSVCRCNIWSIRVELMLHAHICFAIPFESWVCRPPKGNIKLVLGAHRQFTMYERYFSPATVIRTREVIELACQYTILRHRVIL